MVWAVVFFVVYLGIWVFFGVGVLSTLALGEGERDRGAEEVEGAALGVGGGLRVDHDGSCGAVADVVAGEGG